MLPVATTMSSSADNAAKPSLKRPLFNKPAWSRPAATVDTTDFFHRSNQIFVENAVEEDLSRKRRAARKAEKKSSHQPAAARAGKRRRLSNDNDSEDGQAVIEGGQGASEKDANGVTPTRTHTKATAISPSPAPLPESPKSLAQRYEDLVVAAKAAKTPQLPPNIVDLEDDNEVESGIHKDPDADSLTTSTALSKPQAAEYDGFISSDEEFAELARKAREKARTKRTQTESFKSATPDPASQPNRDISAVVAEQSSQPTLPTPEVDPVVSILLTSTISNTSPLIVSRRLGQRLKDVRLAWCQRQGFTPDFTSTVILTWRGKRLYDVSTCRSLGIGVDADGNVVTKGEKDVFGEEDRQIHMEAMTEEMFEAQRRERERAAALEAQDANEDEVPMAEQPKAEEQIRIILRSKGHEEFKLIVKPVSAPPVGPSCCTQIANGDTVNVGIPYHQRLSPEQRDSTN